MKKIKYVLGLDPGVSSIGWGIVEVDDSDMPVSIIDHGSVIFNSLDNDKGQLYNQVRREKRGLRRVIRRRKERLRRIKNLIINSLDVKEEDFYNFFNRKNFKQDNDILLLNIYGLENKLNLEQLTRVLINYAKNRGFKSNRKINSSSEQGEMKKAVSKIEAVMDKYNCTVSKAVLIYQEENSLPVRHNTDSENGYNYGYTRKDVLDELSALLDKQIEYGVISKEFKERYIGIWSSQRDFSDGPASGPYRVNFIKTFGRCTFRSDQVRVSKACPSYEFYTLVKKLQDLKYYLYDEHGQIIKEGRKFKKYSLSKDEVNICFDYALNNAKGLSYAKIREIITRNSNKKIEFPDLPSISDANFKKIVTKYKEKNSIRLDVKLNDKQYNEVRMLAKEVSYEENIYSLKSYNNLKNQLKKIGYEYKADEIDFLDDVSMILAFAKTDKKIEEIATKGEYKDKFSVEEIEIIKKLESPKTGTGSICLSLTKELLDLMLEGNTYDESLQKLGFDHSKPERHNFVGGFPTIEEIEKHYHTILTNPNVKHTLVYLRRLYNSIVEKYGTPYRVHIELARDIAKSYKARKEIENEQKENYTSRLNAKIAIAETIGLNDIMYKNYKSFSNDDILKFRLWNEQKHICVYTGEEILSSQLLNDNLVNVDHILPFSRSFDDSYSNKVLTFTKANEEKRNKTPFEWLNKDRNKWLEFKKRVNDNPYFSSKKRNNLLNEDEVTFDEFSPRSLNATSYISKLALSIFKDLLNVGENDDKVLAFKGGATSFLRKNYRLNQYTHSYESKDYLRNTTHYIIDSKSLVLSSSKTSASIEVEAKNQYDM